MSKCDRLLTKTAPVCKLLSDLISAGHGPFGDLLLHGELDVHLVVDLEATIDRFGPILA